MQAAAASSQRAWKEPGLPRVAFSFPRRSLTSYCQTETKAESLGQGELVSFSFWSFVWEPWRGEVLLGKRERQGGRAPCSDRLLSFGSQVGAVLHPHHHSQPKTNLYWVGWSLHCVTGKGARAAEHGTVCRSNTVTHAFNHEVTVLVLANC